MLSKIIDSMWDLIRAALIKDGDITKIEWLEARIAAQESSMKAILAVVLDLQARLDTSHRVVEMTTHINPGLTETSCSLEEKEDEDEKPDRILHGEYYYYLEDSCPECDQVFSVKKDFPDLRPGENFFAIDCDCGCKLQVDVIKD